MALIIENGSGVPGANSYIYVAFMTAYLVSRDRETENGYDTATADAREAAIIKATQYVDTRWGPRFRGAREHCDLRGWKAVGSIRFDVMPTDGDTVTVGNAEFTFVTTALTSTAENAVEIAANLHAMADALEVSVNKVSREVTANVLGGTEDTVTLTATEDGAHGNFIPLSSSNTNQTITDFKGGVAGGLQPLEFPRRGLYAHGGARIEGIPDRLCSATVEYAVRALAGTLYQDPDIHTSGRTVQETAERVGPIEERTVFAEGENITHTIKPYPAADRLLGEYVTSGASVIR